MYVHFLKAVTAHSDVVWVQLYTKHTHTRTHARTHTYIHTHTHTHTHIYMLIKRTYIHSSTIDSSIVDKLT